MLAAGCRGNTREERISDAVELLALVERYALAGKETRRRIRARKEAKAYPNVENSSAAYSRMLNQFQKAMEIRDAAISQPGPARSFGWGFSGSIGKN